jgi:hypothetical protein
MKSFLRRVSQSGRRKIERRLALRRLRGKVRKEVGHVSGIRF